MSFLFKDIRALFFFSALIIYGAFGSPTPDTLGWVEGLIAGLLLVSINFSLLKNFFTKPQWIIFRWRVISFILIIYGVIAPSIIALSNVTNISEMVRDLVAFGFIMLPFFFIPFFKDSAIRQRALLFGVLGIALLFTLRTIWVHYIQASSAEFKLLYLANSPLILWAALFCITQGGYHLTKNHGLRLFIVSFGIATVLGLANASMAADTQRAFLLATAVTVFITLIGVFARVPYKAIIILAGAGLVYFIFPSAFHDLLNTVMGKTQLVGFNLRFEEWQAVWNVIASNPLHLFFGIGWGNGFNSPAVANIYVTYTHSLLSFMLLKTGFIGFVLTLIYLFTILGTIWKILLKNGYVALAYFWPFIIPIFFYASYKSFDFGLLLTLILVTTIKLNYYPQKP